MDKSIKGILKFTDFLISFQHVERIIYVKGKDRDENDAEHSFQLALLSWFIISTKKLNYDLDKIIRYALVHDLVEIYAGDTYFATNDKKAIESKHDREAEALKKIESEFPEFKELPQLIKQYESKSDPESKFIYSLDKVIPVLNIYLDGGRSWKRDKISFEVIADKRKKVEINDDILNLWLEFVELLDENKDQLFYNV